MERFLNFETRQRFQVNLDTGAITVEPSKIVPIPAEEVKTPKQEVSEDTDWMGFEGPLRAGLFRRFITRDTPELPEVKFNFNLPINDQEELDKLRAHMQKEHLKTIPPRKRNWLQELEEAIKESWNQEAAEGGMAGNPFRALHERMAEATKRWINPDPEREAFIQKVEKEAEEADRREKELANKIMSEGTNFGSKQQRMDFSEALKALKEGKKVRRIGWNKVSPIMYKPKSVPSLVWLDEEADWDYPFVANNDDILATDWIVVE